MEVKLKGHLLYVYVDLFYGMSNFVRLFNTEVSSFFTLWFQVSNDYNCV